MIGSDSILVAYVDGELDATTEQKVEALLAVDPHALKRVEMFRETAAMLRIACDDRFYAEKRSVPVLPRRRDWRQHRNGWAVAASLAAIVAAFGGGAMWGGRAPAARAELIDEVAGYHQVHSRETRHLVEVPADQLDHLMAWLGQRLEHKLVVPDLTTVGLRFVGGRLDVADGRPLAVLMYTREQGLPIGICITRMAGSSAEVTVEQRGAQRVASWIMGGYAYLVVGEIDDPTAENLAARIAAQIES
jgi:anti-sigma factor RsiW